MNKRVMSGITGTLFVLVVLFFGQRCPWVINIIAAIISALATGEIFSVIGITKKYYITVPTLAFVSILPIFGYATVWQGTLYIYSLAIFFIMILNPKEELKIISLVYTMALVIAFGLGSISKLRALSDEFGSFYVLLALSIAWLSDTGAYFSGKLFGKNKLCPEISPKKTIEGFIGGILLCVSSLVIIACIFNNLVFAQKHFVNYFLVIILGLIGSLISALGDLSFSVVKRKYGVKDFGKIVPGHGGILDRFDSVIFVAPYVFLFLKIIKIIS